MKLVVGLGNPGREYENTRHNIGFMLVDLLVTRARASFSEDTKNNCSLAKLPTSGSDKDGVWVIKPQTFMNKSGDSIAKFVNFYKIPYTDVLVCHDDMDLDLGVLKLKQGGGHSGHNGIRSIFERCGEKRDGQDFFRYRLGIGRPQGGDVVQHVLDTFHPGERDLVDQTLTRAVEALEIWVSGNPGKAMTMANRTRAPKE